jgi:hypothetical protein
MDDQENVPHVYVRGYMGRAVCRYGTQEVDLCFEDVVESRSWPCYIAMH